MKLVNSSSFLRRIVRGEGKEIGLLGKEVIRLKMIGKHHEEFPFYQLRVADVDIAYTKVLSF
jgi:hypothetical protein